MDKVRTRINLQQFAMPNPDLTKTKEDYRAELQAALDSGNTEEFGASFMGYMSAVEEAVMREARSAVEARDSDILSTRGARQLTSKEKEFYEKTIAAMESGPSDSLTGLTVVMPETIIDAVFEDLKIDHELLSVIDFKHVTGLTKILINTDAKQLAVWGELTSEITQEIKSSFTSFTLEQNKLSALALISQDMLALGPVWLDRYIREILYEALAFGLEKGILSGTGSDEPIGMDREADDDSYFTVKTGYNQKTPIPVTSLDPESYGLLLSKLAKTAKGNPRVVKNVILVVNPVDYLQKIMPATTIRGADGRYVNNILPYPTRVIQSVEVTEGQAVIGLADRYWMGFGLTKDGKIEHADQYLFFEDYRAYKIRFLGHGQPKDNNSFALLDISCLKPASHRVEVLPEGPVNTMLCSLEITDTTDWDPAFVPGHDDYEAKTEADKSVITAKAMDPRATIAIKQDGSTDINNYGYITWTQNASGDAGDTKDNVIKITVTDPDDASNETEYEVTVTHTIPASGEV